MVEKWQAVVVGEDGGLIGIAVWRDKQWCRCNGMVEQLVMVEEWQAVVVGESGGVTGSAGWSGRQWCKCSVMVR
jgi:hypothetical protein